MPRIRIIARFLGGLALGVSVTLLVAFNILLAWVATGPRSLDVVTPYIENALSGADKYAVSIGESWLVWDGWQHPIDFRLRNVKVMTSERHTYYRFPEISLGLDLLALMTGQVLPTSLTITHPLLNLYQNEDRSIGLGLSVETPSESPAESSPESSPESPVASPAGSAEQSPAAPPAESPAGAPSPKPVPVAAIPFNDVIAPFIAPAGNSPLRKLHYVAIVDADLTVASKDKGAFFSASNTDIIFRHTKKGLQAFGSARISYDNYTSDVSAQFQRDRDSPSISGNVTFSQLMPATLGNLFFGHTPLSAMKFPVSGKSVLILNVANDVVDTMEFAVDGGKGSLESDKLAGILPITALHLEGSLNNNMTELTIHNLDGDFGGILIKGDAQATINHLDSAIKANLSLDSASAESVPLFWPPSLSPMSREWVTANITSGKIPHAEVHVNIAAGDLAKPALPKDAIDAGITIEGARIRYLPEHPYLNDVKGAVHIDGVSLSADIASATYMKDTKLSSGKLLIPDLNEDNPYIKLELTAESTARDAVKFLGLPRLKHAQRLNLQEEQAEGTLKGHAALGFRFFAPRDESGNPVGDVDLDYDLTVELKNISQPGFMSKFDIKNADGTLTVNNTAVNFKGVGTVNGATVLSSEVKYLFHPQDAFDTIIEVSAHAPVEALPRFGYPAFPFLKGALGVKATVKEGKDSEQAQADIDLTDAAINWPTLGLFKQEKIPATLELTSEKKEGVATIPSFRLKGRELEAHGSAELSHDLSDVKRVTLDKVINGNTMLEQLVYEPMEGGFLLHLSGSSFDATPWMTGGGGEGGFSFERFPALDFKGSIDKVTFGEGRQLVNVSGTMSCGSARCGSASIAGKTTDGKPFSFRILRNPKGARQVSLHAQSAGAFLRATDLFDGMEGGDLSLTGTYEENSEKTGSVLHGRLDINDHEIKNAPVLAKILSLASLTGFFDTLQGKGIHFKRLNAPFTLAKDVVTLEDAKTYGNAMGLTAEGTITFPQRTLDIQGTLVPSYTLNTVLGKVPLVGAVLTGGEGGGVFAARYKIKGSGSDPQVSVNPLSILTPGFLRGLFDILDKPKKHEDTEAAPEEEGDAPDNKGEKR